MTGVVLFDTEYLKSEGYLELRELAKLIAEGTAFDENTVKVRLRNARWLFVHQKLIVLPSDRGQSCLYAPELVPFFVAYFKWCPFGEYCSAIDAVDFYERFIARDDDVLRHLPLRMRRQLTKPNKAKALRRGNVAQLIA